MLSLKNTLMLLCLAAACYAMLNYHFLFFGGEVKLLKKSSMNFEYIFFNLSGKRPETIIAVDALRRDGVGDILVELGLLNEERMRQLMEKYESE